MPKTQFITLRNKVLKYLQFWSWSYYPPPPWGLTLQSTLWIFALYEKNLQTTHTFKFFPTYYCGCPYEKKKIQKISFTPAQVTFRTTSTIFFIFFSLIKKKSSYKPQLKLFQTSLKILLEFWDPPTNKIKKKKNFTYGVLGSIIG